jgi:hypothetical protein
VTLVWPKLSKADRARYLHSHSNQRTNGNNDLLGRDFGATIRGRHFLSLFWGKRSTVCLAREIKWTCCLISTGQSAKVVLVIRRSKVGYYKQNSSRIDQTAVYYHPSSQNWKCDASHPSLSYYDRQFSHAYQSINSNNHRRGDCRRELVIGELHQKTV